MKNTLYAAVLALLPAAALAAESPDTHSLSGNLTLTSTYLYRGIDQTNGKPALQGGFDYAHASGFYAGAWGSTISWLADQGPGISAPLELDIYGGYRQNFADDDWYYDVGVLSYRYPGSYPAGFTKPDTTEIHAQIGWKSISFKYSSVVSSHIFGATTPTGGKTRGSGYADLALDHDLGSGWGINAHLGHQSVKDVGDASYTDYRLGVSKDLGFGSLGVYVSGSNAKGKAGQPYHNAYNRDLGADRVVVSFTKTL